jgi:uncharacterized damage-inducible protein DinB
MSPIAPIAPWFERKFEFNYPVERHPNLCARLRGTPARLEEMLGAASHDSLVKNPPGKWSAQEHAGHLLDLEPLWSARLDDFFTDVEGLTVADLSNRKTSEANHNSRVLAKILADFRTARFAMLRRIAKFTPEDFARTKLHPRLKQPMRLVDHLYFVAEHDDHHLAIMWELINA